LAGRVRDAFFRYVTLLLNTSATNGAQNNTFLDSSTNNFSITRNGDTTQGSFNPYMPSGYWSGYFDGTDDRLTAPNNAAFQFGTGAYTIESWVYLTALDTDAAVIFESGNATNGIGLFIAGSSNPIGARKVYVNRYGAGEVFATTNACIVLNAWNHVAVVRSSTSSNDTKIYVNGVLEGTGTDSNNWTVSTTPSIGGLISFSTYDVFGYLSNLRVVKGTAVYTAAFTPPTTPLTAITNTSLLCLQDNRFKDNSTNAFAITRNGDTRISKFAPFNPPASYSTASYGGSGYFDGTGDYLSIADSATIRFGTGTFTIQGWVYRGAAGATHTIAAKGGASTGWVLQITSTNVLRFTDTTTNIDTTTTIPASTWAHVAVVRTGTGANGLKLYINAVDSATGTSSTDFSQTDALNIGADRSNANAFNGYISNLKYTVGTAESISVPASPITGGTVLLNFTNAGIFDAATINNGQTVGNAQVSTTQAKWGTTSMYFDGTGDWFPIQRRVELSFGTGSFTIEGWINVASVDATYRCIFSIGTPVQIYARSGTIEVYFNDSDDQVSYIVNGQTGPASSITANTWAHFAVVRDGTTFTTYVNGVGGTAATGVSAAVFYSAVSPLIGVAGPSLTLPFTGYIQDLRITNGYARYTANFTAPTSAFPTL
jgi:hypothetical protein